MFWADDFDLIKISVNLLLKTRPYTYACHHLRLGRNVSSIESIFWDSQWDGFFEIPRYMRIHMSHALRIVIRQLKVSSHRQQQRLGEPKTSHQRTGYVK